jgi:transketolase
MREVSTESFLRHTEQWDKLLSVSDELLDISLNYRQSGHPGGSRSKMHILLATMLSGAMHWDLLRPWRPLQDRFVLSAGHTVPAVYTALAVLNEALLASRNRAVGGKAAFPDGGEWALLGRDLLTLRRRGGLPGHAEMAGKSLFLKFNTGPSGHGMPPAAGEALALRRSGASHVKVFCLEGEGGLTTGAAHETKNIAWGLGLSNLIFLIDWNDYGIDQRAHSSVVAGTPADWFAPAGWRVVGTDSGMEWAATTRAIADAVTGPDEGPPTAAWFRTRKGRGYGKFDASSHGTPWPMNSPQFWELRGDFMQRFRVRYEGYGEEAPTDASERHAQAAANIEIALGVLRSDQQLVELVTETITEIAGKVPDALPGTYRGKPMSAQVLQADPALVDPLAYPESLWLPPGRKAANRTALSAWGSYVNAYCKKSYDRPLFIACSADLAASTGITGFGHDWDGVPGFGWYERNTNTEGAVLPTQITEFTNAGLMTGLATVNLADDPFHEFSGFWGACSTYGAFSYLAYGPLRLFSQLAQDSPLKVGKVLYVASHSGPETAEDSRTHFGIFEPGIMQLFPRGHVLDLHPWEYNEVPVMLAAALRTEVPIIALNLTRPEIEIPDRARLGIAPRLAAAQGAYLIRDPDSSRPSDGTVIVRGTMPTSSLVSLLPEISERGYNVKIVAAVSLELFLRQPAGYRDHILPDTDKANSMVITNGSLQWMTDWSADSVARRFSLSPELDGRWRTGGDVQEVMDEAGLSPAQILEGISRFVLSQRAAR